MKFICYFTMLAFFVPASLSDMKNGKIPNRVFCFGLAAFPACALLSGYPGTVSGAGLLVSSACCLLIFLFWKYRLLGGGDVKLLWLLFLYLPGIRGICCLALLFFLAFPAAVYGVFSGTRRVRLGGAMLLALIIVLHMEEKLS